MKCPLLRLDMSTVPEDCLKEQCAWWVSLTLNNSKVGKCTFTWLPVLLIELRCAIEKKELVNEKGQSIQE